MITFDRLYSVTKINDGEKEKDYYYQIISQPTRYYVIAWAYHHLWERPSTPIMLVLEKIHKKIFGGYLGYIPLTCRQDLRCYRLHQKKRIVLYDTYDDTK